MAENSRSEMTTDDIANGCLPSYKLLQTASVIATPAVLTKMIVNKRVKRLESYWLAYMEQIVSIHIRPSPTADTRTCDFTKVSKDTLLESSQQHIRDVGQALAFFSSLLTMQAVRHDTDKLTDIDGFHGDFLTGFKEQGWWTRHRALNRHHLLQEDGIPVDVNLVDVLDFIADCVMAGMARSGSVYELKLPAELLERAFQNTVDLLKRQVVVDGVVDDPQAEVEGERR